MKKTKLNFGIVLNDVFLSLSFVFISLVALLMAFINVKTEDGGVQLKAEFIITMNWDKEVKDDIDLYVEDPLGNICFFRAREVGFMSLERDDTGVTQDTYKTTEGKLIEYDNNTENITIRAIIPGEYVINSQLYTLRNDNKPLETPRKVEIIVRKLNPKLVIVSKKTLTLKATGDEKTALRMILDKKGNIIELNESPKNLANKNSTKLDYSEGEYQRRENGESSMEEYQNGFELARPPSQDQNNNF